jgi:hypothetical protein
MKTLSPVQYFLRVKDKYFPSFIFSDSELTNGAGLAYACLFHLAQHRDHCWPSQAALARMLHCCERTVQGHLETLVKLEYISIDRQTGRNIYTLLLPPRLIALLVRNRIESTGFTAAPPSSVPPSPASSSDPAPVPVPVPVPVSSSIEPAPAPSASVAMPAPSDYPQNLHVPGTDLAPDYPQNLRVPGADFASDLRIRKEEIRNTPPSPPPASRKPSPLPKPERGVFSSRSQSQNPEPKAQTQTQGTETPGAAPGAVRDAAIQAAFERLWAAWPVKKDKLFASRIHASLARAGILPPLPQLLAVIERLKQSDQHWQNGYPPKLTWWLKGHCWNDEPFDRQSADKPDEPACSPEMRQMAENIQQRFCRPQPETGKEPCPPEVTRAWLEKIWHLLRGDSSTARPTFPSLEEYRRNLQAFKQAHLLDSGEAALCGG